LLVPRRMVSAVHPDRTLRLPECAVSLAYRDLHGGELPLGREFMRTAWGSSAMPRKQRTLIEPYSEPVDGPGGDDSIVLQGDAHNSAIANGSLRACSGWACIWLRARQSDHACSGTENGARSA